MDITLDTIRDIKIYQNKKGYRFSVDALLLYSFVNLKHASAIADMGAGSGVIGLLLARKYQKSKVLLIELQDNLAKLAKKNILINNLEERVMVINTDIVQLKSQSLGIVTPNSFDLVVSNPPFRRQKTGMISPIDEKAIARHEIKINLPDLINASQNILRSKGRFCIIYHPSRLIELIDALRKKKLEPKRLQFVHSDQNTEAKMVLVEAVKEGRAELKTEKPLFIYKTPNTYSDEMQEILSG